METSSKDPLASAAEGVTRAFLGLTGEKIKRLAARFRKNDIAFVEDPEIMNLAKKQRKTSEWKLFITFIGNDKTDLRVLFQMGLTLRGLESEQQKVKSLRNTILKKYGRQGLHIAQFIQNGFFGKFLGNILERTSTPQKLKFEIENLLQNIERTVIFIKQTDDVEMKTEEIITKIQAHSPNLFIVCSGGRAKTKCGNITKKVMKRISGYDAELYETTFKEMYFINKSEELFQ